MTMVKGFEPLNPEFDTMLNELCTRAGMTNNRWPKEIYRRLITQEDAKMLLSLPATVKDFAEKNGLDEATAKAKLENYHSKGVAIGYKHDEGTVYKNPGFYMQLHDATGFPIMYDRYPMTQEQKEIPQLWQNWRRTDAFTDVWNPNLGPIGFVLRICPWPDSVEDPSQLLPIEDVKQLIYAVKDVVVNKCWCRYADYEEGNTTQPPLETCLHFDDKFENDFLVENGLGRRITHDEAWEIAQGAARAGLIPLANGGKLLFNMCMCDTDGCVLNRAVAKYDYETVFPSRYLAVVDQDKCTGCGTCAKKCRYYAITMQKDPVSGEVRPSVNAKKCMGCGVCAIQCPSKSLILKCVRPKEWIAEEVTCISPYTEV